MNADWRSRYEVMVEAARAAGQVALGYFDRGVTVHWKEDQSPVTVADRNAEQALRQRLSAAFPNDGFLGEEFGASPGSTGYRWIIDPIDGTRDFVRGNRAWAVLIGLEEAGDVVAGAAYLPAMNEMFTAARGTGAFLNGERIRASAVSDPAQAVLCVNGFTNILQRPFSTGLLHGWRNSGRCAAWVGAWTP